MKGLLHILVSGFSLLAVITLLPGTAIASAGSDAIDQLSPTDTPAQYNSRQSRSFSFDNDILVPGSRDQDYTYGLNLTFAGGGVEDHRASLHSPLDWLDRRLGLHSLVNNSVEASKIEYGLFGFTPEDITQAAPKEGDRPYASLIYAASSHERYNPASETSWTSTFTVGFMGLSIVGDIQDSIHANINGDRPKGWHNQISDGGEVTARYSLARKKLIYKSDTGMEIKSTVQGSVGYITEASWSVSLRAGNIQSPWVSFNPELTSYGEKSISSDPGRAAEHYFWTGVSVKARAYNAFLQGQFRNSAVSYDSDELNHGIVEAWVGYSVGLAGGYSFTYSIRGHTSELKQGVGDRNVIWGSLQISRNFI